MLLLPEELQQQILRYLAGRPYNEVADGIAELRALRRINEADLVMFNRWKCEQAGDKKLRAVTETDKAGEKHGHP